MSSQGAVWKYSWPWEIIWPQDACGSGTPMPRYDSEASMRIEVAMPRVE